MDKLERLKAKVKALDIKVDILKQKLVDRPNLQPYYEEYVQELREVEDKIEQLEQSK